MRIFTMIVKVIDSNVHRRLTNRQLCLFSSMEHSSSSFIGTFKVNKPGKSNVQLFTIMNVHLRPESAYEELLAMRYVIEDFIADNRQYFNYSATALNDALEQNVVDATVDNKPTLNTAHPILIVGDFNADCRYISKKRQELLRSVHSHVTGK
jgi:hypothetical protein